MGADDSQSVLVQLTALRGDMTTGFARLGGQLDVIAQKQDTTARDVDELDQRVTALEARRVPWALLSSMATAGGALGAVAGILAR